MPRLSLAPATGTWRHVAAELKHSRTWPLSSNANLPVDKSPKLSSWVLPLPNPPVRWPLPSLLPEWAERELAGLWICNLRRKGSVWNGTVFSGVSILPNERKSVPFFSALPLLKAIKHDGDRRQLSAGQCESCLLYLQQEWKLSCLLDGCPQGLKWSSNGRHFWNAFFSLFFVIEVNAAG